MGICEIQKSRKPIRIVLNNLRLHIYDFSSIAALKINFKYGGNTARRLHINLFFELCKNLQNIKTHYGSVMHL